MYMCNMFARLTSSSSSSSSKLPPSSLQDQQPADDKDEAKDERARALALKAFGVAPGGRRGKPVGVKVAPATEGAEVDDQAVWGDYLEYMDHQRTKGWKT